MRAFNPTVAEHGYQPAGSVLEVSTDDLPFLVDSVTAELTARGFGIVRVPHPIIGTERDAQGHIVRLAHPGQAPATESVMHFELDRRLAPEELAVLEDAVRKVLAAVRKVVSDFPAMGARLDHMVAQVRAGASSAEPGEAEEAIAFLEWLRDDHFILLGYRDDDAELGIPVDPLPPARELLEVRRTSQLSPVHRRARTAAQW